MKKTSLILFIIMILSFMSASILFFQSGFFDFEKGYVTEKDALMVLDELNTFPFIYSDSKLSLKEINITRKIKLDGDILSLKIDSISTDLEIKETDSDLFVFNLHGYGTSEKIAIHGDDNAEVSMIYPRMLNNQNNLTLSVEIPREYNKEIFVQTISGDTKINDLSNGKINYKTTSGELILKNSKLIYAKSISGEIKLENFEIKENLEINTISGDVEIKTTSENFGLKFESVSGDSNKKDSIGYPTLFVKTVSGDLDFE